jgi:hypothetical protein
MHKTLLIAVVGLCINTAALAQPPLRELDDAELSQVRAGDGISIAGHFVLNDPAVAGISNSRLTWGMKDAAGQTSYVVIKNPAGVIDMFAVTLDVMKRPDGGNYIALGLPVYLKYTNYGFESLSVQSDPQAPITGNLGSFNLNGTLSLQGQVRFWAH